MCRRQIGCLISMVILLVWVSVVLAGTVSEEARRYMARGIAAVEMAKSASDYALAAKEFEQAAKLAPDWPDIYYNLGSVQSKSGDITSAIKSFQRYLDLAPKSPDAAKVREEIFKLEYRRDREKLVAALEGTWTGPNGQTFALKLEGSRLQLTRARLGDDILVVKSMGTSTGPMTDVPLVFSGTLVGDKISGQYLQAAGKSGKYCDMPERKGDFEGTVDVAAGQMRIVYNRVTLKYQMQFKSLLSDELVCRQTNRQETPGYVLELKRRP
jgi:tetratricopeptide (TPR) repeat protein